MKQSKLRTFVKSYWEYYLELEEQFSKTKKYVSFDIYNKKTYSVEYLKLLQAVCSEIDVVAKEIASDLDPSFVVDNNTTIKKWGYVLQNKLPAMLCREIVFNDEICVCPWKNWLYEQSLSKKGALNYKLKNNCKTPSWWVDYNSVKHARTKIGNDGEINYTKANLENLIKSYAALHILESCYIDYLSGDIGPDWDYAESKLFRSKYSNEETRRL